MHCADQWPDLRPTNTAAAAATSDTKSSSKVQDSPFLRALKRGDYRATPHDAQLMDADESMRNGYVVLTELGTRPVAAASNIEEHTTAECTENANSDDDGDAVDATDNQEAAATRAASSWPTSSESRIWTTGRSKYRSHHALSGRSSGFKKTSSMYPPGGPGSRSFVQDAPPRRPFSSSHWGAARSASHHRRGYVLDPVDYDGRSSGSAISSSGGSGGGGNGFCRYRFGSDTTPASGFQSRKLRQVSYGIVLFRRPLPDRIPEYVVMCRRHSFGFVELVRGNFDHSDEMYLRSLLEEMTVSEREHVSAYSFDTLWSSIWMNSRVEEARYHREFREAQVKFEALVELPMFKMLLREANTHWTEPEWGFPKGKKDKNELSIGCAMREMMEETQIPSSAYTLLREFNALKEEFTGTDFREYQHIYYVAEAKDPNMRIPDIDHSNVTQVREVSDIRWASLQEIQTLFRPYNHEKLNLIENLDARIRQMASFQGEEEKEVAASQSGSISAGNEDRGNK